MTTFQREVLRQLFATAGAIRYAGAWVFPDDIRRDRVLASAIYWDLLA